MCNFEIQTENEISVMQAKGLNDVIENVMSKVFKNKNIKAEVVTLNSDNKSAEVNLYMDEGFMDKEIILINQIL